MIVKMQTIQLPDTTPMPIIGFGTWQLSGIEGRDAIQTALQAGYRLLDTAKMYGNEREVGHAVRESGIIRPNIYITTKLKPAKPSDVDWLVQERLNLLQVDYLDVLLIHWPAESAVENMSTWERFIKAKNMGYINHIGVSNFSIGLIEGLLEQSLDMPEINQIEVHPLNYPDELIKYCHDKGIVVQAYSPFGRGSLLKQKSVVRLSKKYNVSPSQLLVRWSVQHNLVPLPRSQNPEHIVANIEVFDFTISKLDMQVLDELSG